MVDQEMLEAMRAIQAETLAQIDEKLEKQNQQIDEKLEKQNQQIDEKLEKQSQQIDEKLEKQSQRMLHEFNVVIEDKVSHEIRAIAEGHSTILKRLPDADEQEQLKSRVRVLERVVEEHSKTIAALKKAQ